MARTRGKPESKQPRREERDDRREAQTQTQNALTLWSEPRSTLRSTREREREDDVVGVPEGVAQKERMLSPDTVKKLSLIHI